MSHRRSSMLASPSAVASPRPISIGRAATSIPRNRAPGSPQAMGTMFPPAPHPSSSTRHRSTGAGLRPYMRALAAMRSGCECSHAPPG